MATCSCKCHRHGSSGPHILPDVTDPLETLLACGKCRDQHYPPLPWTPPFSTGYDPTDDTD